MKIIVVPSTRTIPPPSTPTLIATANGQTQIDLAAASIAGAGATIARYYFQVATSSGGPWSALTDNSTGTYSHTGLTAGQTRHYRVRAVDSAGQESSYSSTASASTSSPSTFRENPGFYLLAGTNANRVNLYQDTFDYQIERLNTRPWWTGFAYNLTWAAFENTQGNYQFTELNRIYNKLGEASSAAGRTFKLVVGMIERSFGQTSDSSRETVPNYIQAISNGSYGGSDGYGYAADMGNATVMGHWINANKALLDWAATKPNVEMIVDLGETSVLRGHASSESTWLAQFERKLAALGPYSATKGVMFAAKHNFAYGGAEYGKVIKSWFIQHGVVLSTPDVYSRQPGYPLRDVITGSELGVTPSYWDWAQADRNGFGQGVFDTTDNRANWRFAPRLEEPAFNREDFAVFQMRWEDSIRVSIDEHWASHLFCNYIENGTSLDGRGDFSNLDAAVQARNGLTSEHWR